MPQLDWYYNELQQIGVDFASQAEVEAYDRKQTSNSPEACRELLDRLGVGAEDTLLEFGTATGTLTLEAAKRCRHAHGVDVSQAMVDYARTKARVAELSNVTFVHAGFLSYVHEDEPVDFVLSKFALHHLPDFWKARALKNVAAALRLGGRFYLKDVVFSFDITDADTAIETWIEDVTKHSGFTRSEFEMHVREEYSTYDWLLDELLEKAGFKILEKNCESPTYAEYLCERVS